MIVQGLSIELLIRLMNSERPLDDSWLLFGPERVEAEEEEEEEEEHRWAAE